MHKHPGRFAIRFLISAFVAGVTPAVAAGVVVGVSAAVTTVADATQPSSPVGQPQNVTGTTGRIATHGPARLSVLVSNADLARQHAVHANDAAAKQAAPNAP